MAETNKVHNPKKTAVGIVTLRNEIYCSESALADYESQIEGVSVHIFFPQYVVKRDKDHEYTMLISPTIAKSLKRGEEDLDWGSVMEWSTNPGAELPAKVSVSSIALECKEEDVQTLYEIFPKWYERFHMYCLLCNKQYINAPSPAVKGESCYVEFIGKTGYIHPLDARKYSIEATIASDEAFLQKEDIVQAINFASSEFSIRQEYCYMLEAYEAARKKENRLVLVNVCMALEVCLQRNIDLFCKEHSIPEQAIKYKYRYLGDLLTFFDLVYKDFTYAKEVREKVVEPRNNLLHGTKESNPSWNTIYEAVNTVEKILKFFNENYYE